MGLKLIGEVALDGSGFEKGLQRLGSTAASNLKNFVVGAFGIYGIQQAIHKTVEAASDLVDASQRLDLTVEQLQILQQAAKDGGTELSTLTSAFEKLDVARGKIFRGDKDAANLRARFAELGVTDQMLKTQTAASITMGPISEKVRTTNVERIALQLKEIFGRSFGELIPVLKTDFDELRQKMGKFGLLMDADTAVKLDRLGDELSLLSRIIVVQLGPALVELTSWILQRIAALKGAGAGFKDLATRMNESGLSDDIGPARAAITKLGFQIMPEWLLRLHFTDKTIAKWAEVIGESAKVSANVEKEGLDQIAAMREKLSEEARKLDHPKPIFGLDEEMAQTKSKTKKLQDADALVRVGNFLGTSKDAINNIAQEQLLVAKQSRDYLRTIATRAPAYQGDVNDTFYPVA